MPISQATEEPRAHAGDGDCRVLAGHDPRADGASRQIAVDRQRVSIRRRYQGIEMRVAVPVATYDGIAIVDLSASRDDPGYEVRLAHRDPDLSVTLHRAGSAADLTAECQSWACFFALPSLAERSPHMLRLVQASEGADIAPRRAPCPIAASALRRPRSPADRKFGLATLVRPVHRGEREITAYD